MTFCELGRSCLVLTFYKKDLQQHQQTPHFIFRSTGAWFDWKIWFRFPLGLVLFLRLELLWLFVYWYVVCFATMMEIDSIFQWRVKWIIIFTAWFYDLIFIDCDKQDSSRKEIVLIFYLLVAGKIRPRFSHLFIRHEFCSRYGHDV